MRYFNKIKVVNTGRTRFKKGMVPWNNGTKKVLPKCERCGADLKRYGKSKFCKKHREHTWGYKISRIKKGKPNFNVRGEKHGLWKGGITPINNKIRYSLKGKMWERGVILSSGNCCKRCGECRISKLMAHHIKNFSSCPDLRFVISNGVCFCRGCHKLFHFLYGKKNNNLSQIKEFLSKFLLYDPTVDYEHD